MAARRLRGKPGPDETMKASMVRRPSAFVPLLMSAAALAVVLAHVAIFGPAREADEGTAAHLWQILMVGQLPLIGYFALRHLPENPRRALPVLALQAFAGIAAAAPVFLLGL